MGPGLLDALRAQIGCRRKPDICGGRPSNVVDNILDRQFDVEAPDEVWVIGITHIRTFEGFSYLAVAIDLCSCRVIGWLPIAAIDTGIAATMLGRITATSDHRHQIRECPLR